MTTARMVVVIGCLAVAACGGVKKADEAGNATGKVLPGSISDSMIELDRSRVDAPLAGPGSGIPAGNNEAARDLLAKPRGEANDEGGPSAAPPAPQEQPTKASAAPAAAPTAAPREKPAEKAVEPAAALARPASKPAAKPSAPAPAKPKVKPAFRKPTDDGGA